MARSQNLSMRDYFNPRSPCGERPRLGDYAPGELAISIHALLAESDSKYHQIGPIVSV